MGKVVVPDKGQSRLEWNLDAITAVCDLCHIPANSQRKAVLTANLITNCNTRIPIHEFQYRSRHSRIRIHEICVRYFDWRYAGPESYVTNWNTGNLCPVSGNGTRPGNHAICVMQSVSGVRLLGKVAREIGHSHRAPALQIAIPAP